MGVCYFRFYPPRSNFDHISSDKRILTQLKSEWENTRSSTSRSQSKPIVTDQGKLSKIWEMLRNAWQAWQHRRNIFFRLARRLVVLPKSCMIMMALLRSCKDLGKHVLASWQVYHNPFHWEDLKYKHCWIRTCRGLALCQISGFPGDLYETSAENFCYKSFASEVSKSIDREMKNLTSS